MPRNADLHGNAPDKSNVALLLIDVISDFEFEGGEKLFKHALPMARRLAALREKAKQEDVPVIYVNDNFGKWQSNFHNILEHACHEKVRGSEIAKMLKPDDEDYFVLKPKHSGFFSTTLDILLEYLQCETLILTGVTTDICILFTANDAYMRDFDLVIPNDCVAAVDKRENAHALRHLERVLKADTSPSTKIDFEKLKASSGAF
jgi:nicotinamidase-related amidase